MRSSPGGLLVLGSEKNVTLNARNDRGQLTGQLTVGESPLLAAVHMVQLEAVLFETISRHKLPTTADGETPAVTSLSEVWPEGPEAVEAQCQRLEVRSKDGGQLLFTANEEEVIMTTQKFTVTGLEGAVFGHSVETPLIQARASEDLKLESPTRTLTMEAPRGVEVSAAQGPLKVSGRKDLQLESTEGEILLDAKTIQLGSLPLGVYTESPNQASQEQAVFEVCVCPSGKIYLSPAETSSTCQAMSNICLWS
ncbi:zeta-sarcoglycan-like isoform X3 [Anarrhichthys ocellatus]|uniref:zeta-sarcoglycan-like isoform X3 n=1 Tax=Anarrhichthys ocellatus TaxID=433405 RepID=UPI0012EEB168|nr:zeta-sarcoglycan-like isoform X3 [Anarrhichthys ocellatus]